jgi:D-sedoheptulose 7-phosphate isomerase
MQSVIEETFEKHLNLAARVRDELAAEIARAATCLIECFRDGRKLLLCGNGGSAADAQHIAAELTGRYRREREGLAAVALTTDTSALTAIGNDYGFDTIFARQFQALARPGDVLLAISTSGNSPNVLRALEAARERECPTIGLIGGDGGKMRGMCDYPIVVPSSETPLIQEMHIAIGHLLCELVESHVTGS